MTAGDRRLGRLAPDTTMVGLRRPPQTALARRAATSSLSSRLLLMTIGFVMIAEVTLFAPTMAQFRLDHLRDKIATAHLVLTGLEVATDEIDPLLRDTLLFQSGMLGMTAIRPNLPPRTLGPGIPAKIPESYDLRRDMYLKLIHDAFVTMGRKGDLAIAVTGLSPFDPTVVVEVILNEHPLRILMWDFAWRIFIVTLFISVMVAAMVYASLQWLAVRPLRRLTQAMTSFQAAPEDPARVIEPSDRSDEVGVAERALAEMQQELRLALLQKERLAGVGTAVTKISHDLKNILATAMLESDKLESSADPEVRRLTAGMVRAVDRAVQLSATTLKFAREGLPDVHKREMRARAFLQDVKTVLQPALKTCEIRILETVDFTFLADPELLSRAMDNLVRNAAEAGASYIALDAHHEDGAVVFQLRDNGPGLAQRAKDNLFVPFAGSTRAGGFGLGLPIARELVRVQGGDIALQSTSDQGTCFVIRLPQ